MIVTPNEIARELGVSGLQFRNWLRAKVAAGDPRVASHRKRERWEFDPRLAAELRDDYRKEVLASGRAPEPRPRAARGSRQAKRTPARSATALPPRSSDPGHRVIEDWMGTEVETLEDLLEPGLLAVCVGINPAPRSVAAGHYYQGAYGQRFFDRLRQVGLLVEDLDGYEDDAAFAAGVGFTDLVKRPTRGDEDVADEEREFGRPILERKLSATRPQLVIFTFKSAAKTLLGAFPGNGFVPGVELAGCEVFVMPGPTESNMTAQPTLKALNARVEGLRRGR